MLKFDRVDAVVVFHSHAFHPGALFMQVACLIAVRTLNGPCTVHARSLHCCTLSLLPASPNGASGDLRSTQRTSWALQGFQLLALPCTFGMCEAYQPELLGNLGRQCLQLLKPEGENRKMSKSLRNQMARGKARKERIRTNCHDGYSNAAVSFW